MAYRYNGPRHHRYADDVNTYNYDEQTYEDERQMYNDERQRYKNERQTYDDGHYEAKYREEDTEYSYRRARVTSRHDYEDERNRHTEDYSEGIQSHRFDREISGRHRSHTEKYYDKVSQIDGVPYHNPQNIRRRVPSRDQVEDRNYYEPHHQVRDDPHGQVREIIEHRSGDGYARGRGDTHRGDWQSRREALNRPYRGSSTSSRGSSRYEEFGHTSTHSQHRTKHGIDDQYESFSRKCSNQGDFRDTRHERTYRSATGRIGGPLIKETPVCNNRTSIREPRTESYAAAKKLEPLIKEEPLSDYSDYPVEMQHEPLLPTKRISNKINNIGPLHISSQSNRDISSRPSTGLLATPDIEPENETFITEVDPAVFPTKNVIPIAEESVRGPVYHSAGLHPTPTVTADVNVGHFSTGLLPTPKNSPIENPDRQSAGLLPTPTCSPLGNRVNAAASPIDRDVETIVYPSKGLLPTPTGSPTVAISSHPLMENEDSNTSPHGHTEEQDTFNDNESLVCVNMHEEETENIPIIESNPTAKPGYELSSGNTEKQMLENIQIQIELTKTLEGMQRTMQTLQQKIQTTQPTPSIKKEENEGKDKSDKTRELQKDAVIELSDDADGVEVTDNVGETCDNPLNISSANDDQCIEKSAESPGSSESQNEKIENEFEDKLSRNNSASCESQCITSTEQLNNINQQAKEINRENSRNSKNKSAGPREYKTYREWRLAKERMNRYFNNQSSESEDNIKKKESNKNNISQNIHQSSLKSPNSNLYNKGSDTKNLSASKSKQTDYVDKSKFPDSIKEDILDSRKVLDDRCSPKEVGPDIRHSGRRDSDIVNTNIGDRMQPDKSNPESIGEKFGNKKEETRRERRDSNISNESFSEKMLKKKPERDKTENFYENDRQNNKKSEHKSRHHSSDSLSSHHSRERSTHRHDRSRSRDHDSRRSHKHKSSHKEKSSKEHSHKKSDKHRVHEKSHKHYHHEKHSSASKDKHKHHSSFGSGNGSSQKDSSDKLKKYDSKVERDKNESNSVKDGSKVESSRQKEKVSQHKLDTEIKVNLFEKLALESEIDVVGGISSDENKEMVKNDEPGYTCNVKDSSGSQKNEAAKKLKNVFVKLFDINKSKAADTCSAKKDTNKGRENIFEKMGGKVSSEKTVAMTSALSKSKENLSSKSTKSDKTFNPTVPVSEESSSDIDPFVKMSMFLNKDKKKSVHSKTVPKVLNSSVSKKSKPPDKFLVSDDYVSFTDRSETSESDSDETPQYSSYNTHRKKKEFVKYLKRLNHTLYWKNVKLMLPRINLKRLNDSDIKRLKSKLKRDDKPSNMKRNTESFRNVVGEAERQKQTDGPAKENRNKPKQLKVGASEIAGNEKMNPKSKESGKGDSLHLNSEKTGHYNETTGDRETKSMSKDRPEESAEKPQCIESNNEGMDKRKESSTTAVERKQGNDEHSGKIYRRIIPVSVSSSAEQSESSDIERFVSVSQRDKQGPVIEDSDESEDLEGSLGSEDSTCLDISDASEGEEDKQSSKEELGNKESKAEELNFGKQVQSEIEENADVSVKLPVFENVKNCEELVMDKDKELVSGSKEEGAQEPKTLPLKPDIQIKRNIFSDMTSDCSTQSETDTGTSYISRNTHPEPVRNILDTNTSKLSTVRANLGNTLKNLKVKNLQTDTREESSGPDFVCLPERKAILQRRGLNETTQSGNNISTDENADEVDGIENNDTVSELSVRENNSEVKGTGSETANDGGNKLTCSESAGKNIRRRKFSDSSTDSSDDENFCQNRSSSKYRKKQLDKSTEEKSISPQNSKDDDKGMDKSTGPSDSVFGKHLPLRAKRLFKSSSQMKRSSSIMQMDGNADLISGPPDESSGEEGDVEDNLSCINIESDEENSASQDLFADLPDRLKQMSQKFKQIIETSASCDSIKVEKKDEMNDNKPVAGSHNKEDSNSTTVTEENCLEENKAGNVDTEETVVKEEPDWLKCYTQEPDTIFLSDDDDELIMSVSQPVILVSDEETQDPEADQKPVLDQVKQEKLEPDVNYGTQDSTYELTFENYSSAEDWSDKGSDFEPENMFNSLHKRTTLKTDAVDSDQNLSDISVMSDDDLFKSQSLLEPVNTSNEKGGFESSDGAVMSVNEDELLGSPNSDEAIMSINEDELLGIKSKVTTADHRSKNLKTERKTSVDKDFSSDDDAILSTSVFEIEKKYKRTAATKNEPGTNVITKEDVIEGSQRLNCVQKNMEAVNASERDQDENLASTSSEYQAMTPYMQDTQVDPNVSDENTSNSVSVFDFHSEHFSDISDSDNQSDKETKVVKNSPKPASNKNYDYETLSDDSDIMIIDNPKSEYEVQTQVNQFLHKKGNNSRDNGNNRQIKSVYEEQTQVHDGTSEPDHEIQDQYFTPTQTKSVTYTDSKTQIIKNETDKSVMQDFYFLPTQSDKPEPSSDSAKTLRERSKQYTSQTQALTTTPQLYGSQTQADNPESDVYFEQTQIDQPGPSNLSNNQKIAGADAENVSYDSFSDEDPQLQSYFQQKTQGNTMKNMRLSQNLGIKFETFSDSDEEENNNIYERLTQVKQLARKQKKQTNKGDKSKKAVGMKGKETRVGIPGMKGKETRVDIPGMKGKETRVGISGMKGKETRVSIQGMKGKETRVGIQDDDDIVYHTLTQAISSSDSQDADDYGMLTQIDTPSRARPVAKSVPHPSVDTEAYLAATQINTENVESRKKNIRIISEDDEKGLKNKQQQDSADDDAYLAVTQAYSEDISEPENEQVAETKDLYTLATQKNVDEMSNDKSYDRKKYLVKKALDNDSAFEDVTEDKDFYNMATQKGVYKMSDSDDERKNHGAKASDSDRTAKLNDENDYDAYCVATQLDTREINEPEEDKAAEDEDFYNMATQKDINEMSDSDEQIENKVEKGLDNDTAAEQGDRRDNKYIDEYNVATQKDVNEMPDDDEAYFMETQADELPDIMQIDEDLNMGTTQDYVNKTASVSKQDFLTADNKTDKVEHKSGSKGILKRPNAESTTGRNVTFGVQFESPVPKKPRLSLSTRKILPIEPQKLKTTSEKRASGVNITFKPHQFFKSDTAANVNTDIEIHDATRSDMWLSKNIPSDKILKKGTRVEKARKRKRKEDSGQALQAKMMAARSQLNERAMYNATHPEPKKRMKTGPTATVTSSELEDVTLPSGSQIIDQGLPLLNTTGILLKGHKSAHSGTEPELPPVRVTTATVSIATTTISTATSTSVPSTVQSTSVNITPRLHHSISNTEKKPKDKNSVKENYKHQGKSLPPERSAIKDTRQDELSFQNVDKDHKDKKSESKSNKENSHSRVHGDKNSHRTEKEVHDKAKVDRDKDSKYKEYDIDRKNKEHSHSASRGSGNRERSGSGDSRKDKEQKIKNKSTNKENDKQFHKSDDSRKGASNSIVDIRGDKEKHGKKREDRKHSSDKERHSSGQKEKHPGSKHSESRIKENDSKHKSSENRQNISGSRENKSAISSTESAVSGGIKSVSSTGLSTATSTSLLTIVTPSAGIRMTSTSLFTPGPSSLATASMPTGKTAPNVVKITTAVARGTSTAVSRSISKPGPSVRPTVATHIQSSVLLQKQGSRPPAAASSSTSLAPLSVTSGRQPFQPLAPNIPSNTELMPSNMVENTPNLQWNNFLRVILKWSPNWFEEREKMEQANRRAPPPDVTNDLCNQGNHMLYPLLGKYVSFKEYSEKFMLPLLLHETWESCFSTWREKRGKQKLSRHKLMFSHQAQGGDKLMVYTLIGLISEKDRRSGNYVNEGDLVKITINGDMKIDDKNKKNLDYTMSGFIDKVIFRDFSVDRICAHYKDMGNIRKEMRNCISLKLNVRVRARLFTPSDQVVVHLESVSTIINTWRQFTALSCIPRSPLCRDLLYPTANMTYCDRAPPIVPGLQDKYNESQLTAINTAAKIVSLPREVPRVCLLQGPPGTGKSHTIVGIIKHIVRVTQGKCRMCLCAPSHAAVDELLRRLNKYNRTVDKNSVIKMVRLGKKTSVHQEIQSLCLDTLVQRNILQAQKDELLKQLPQSLQGERKSLENKIAAVTRGIETAKDQFQKQKLRADLRKLEKQKDVLESKFVLPKTNVDPQQERKARHNLLLRAHVVAGTLSRIGGNELRAAFQNVSNPGFDVVIVDEATQAIELETLIPLQYGVTKLILVGDPEQLPPTVLSQVATENKFNMSLFERLDSHFKYGNINPIILLDTQYRMDPEIAAFPNKYVYNGKINNDRCVENRTQITLVPYLLFNVSEGRELFSQGSRSMSNPLEARFTAELCQFIVSNTIVIEKVIGIIAPYAKQKLEILKELEKRGLRNIEVSTVDGFQGREKHVIIMSCVRANESGTVGFVGNRNRMNVSLTRAKYAMYLVGHFESLESSDEWKALIADAKQRRKVIQMDQSSMRQAIKRIMKQQKRDFTSEN